MMRMESVAVVEQPLGAMLSVVSVMILTPDVE